MKAIALLLMSIMLYSPFMVSNPSIEAVNGGYEIFEVTDMFPEGRLAYSAKNEADGSIRMDLNDVPLGTHKWLVRYTAHDGYTEPSAFISCVLVVKSLYYINDLKSFKYSSLTKSWTLKATK